MKPHAQSKFGTGTATLAIFDPLCLAPKVEDTCDWWSVPEDEVAEINAGNVLFAGLGSDGGYTFDVFRLKSGQVIPTVKLKAKIRTIMGSFYIGAGEEVVGEDIGPSTQYGGMLVSMTAGNYFVGINYDENKGHLSIYFKETGEDASNEFTDSPMLVA